ncbi:zona pellucida sperm-binding protein 3-like [Stegastes partitus]|uniref:Zona pellucida sperm-binding protein 3-like n=1 Tax=Stegastes partitus TaxID=144197 RepID=A0A9Y4MW04_9TELE|nr:PREDICTED: zona pellucida sperm-binding protein 3-like [Stegastes partitus]
MEQKLPTVSLTDMKLDCRPDYMTLVWTESRPQADTSLLRLGSCFPTSVTVREAVFSVDLNDCHFRRLVTGNHLMYTNDLIYYSPPNSLIPSFTLPVVCAYERPKDWFPAIYEPVFSTFNRDDLVFHFGLMNADFSGPAESTSFSLGSFIPIMASVEQQHHQPLLLLLDECVAATTPELQHESNLYPIITNKGCLMDSKTSRSKYEPRVKTSEIRLSLQAFKFALGEDVFIHCNLVAWDPNALDHTKKACHYVKDHGWELLDHPTYSSYCDCCETSCKSRKTRSLASGKHGVERKAVLGPITVTDS